MDRAHESWLRTLSFDRLGVQLAFDEAYDAVLTALARRDRLDTAITDIAATPQFAPVVGRLGCLRGVSTLTAFGLTVEIGDWCRFTGSAIGAYLGLVPAESSSGGQRSQGPITKTDNTHARRTYEQHRPQHNWWTVQRSSLDTRTAPDEQPVMR